MLELCSALCYIKQRINASSSASISYGPTWRGVLQLVSDLTRCTIGTAPWIQRMINSK